MHTTVCFIMLLLFTRSFSLAQDTIPVAYGTDFLVFENGLNTFYDSLGNALTPEFKTAKCFYPLAIDGDMCYLGSNEEFECQVDGKWGMMTRKGQVTLNFDFDAIIGDNSRFFVEKDKKWHEVERFNNEANGYSLTVLDCDYVSWAYRVGWLLIKGDRVFFSPESGVISESPAKQLEFGYFQIKHGCDYGAGTVDGKVLLPIIYKNARISSEGITVSDGDKYGFYDPETNHMTDLKYDAIDTGTKDGLLRYKIGSKKGLMRVNGEVLTEPVYESLYPFGDSIIQVEMDGKWGFIDLNGNEKIPCIYEDVDGFKHGLAGAKMDGKWGFINENGTVIIPFQFAGGHMGLYFREYDKAKIKENGKCYYINRKGEFLESCSCR